MCGADPRLGRRRPDAMSFKVAIIGRPNVGKSTLFNRLAGRKLALVDDTPGVTRDRRVHPAKLYDLDFDVIDTAGFEDAGARHAAGPHARPDRDRHPRGRPRLLHDRCQGRAAPDDRTFAEIVRKSGKPVVLVANKSEARGAQGRPAGSLGARPRRAGRRSRPSTARACPTCATRSSPRSARSAPSPTTRTRTSSGRQRGAGRRGHRRSRRRAGL